MHSRRDTSVHATTLRGNRAGRATNAIFYTILSVLAPMVGAGCEPSDIEDATIAPVTDGPTYYVATSGNDQSGNGSASTPWRTIAAAVRLAPDGSTILVRPGTYVGRVAITRKATQGITVRSESPYKAALRNGDRVVTCYGCSGITLEGFDIAHSGPGAASLVVHVDGEGSGTANDFTLRNNVIHDSYNNDLLKINNAARNIRVLGNVFYNQAGSDEHIDINSVDGVTVEDNVFFNDFAASGRTVANETASFVVVKDSNGADDMYLGARNVKIRRNVFLNWQGNAGAGFLLLGEDGMAYFEAFDIAVENNLFVGNSATVMRSPFGVKGCRNTTFRNNTITGDLPGSAFAARINRELSNKANESVHFFNNVWADQTGTMNDFSDAAAADLATFTLSRNLYWNNGSSIPVDGTDVLNHTMDNSAITANPVLANPRGAAGPRWDRSCFAFTDGSATIAQARLKLIEAYGKPGAGSATIDRAAATQVPADDIRGAARGSSPDLGAYEAGAAMPGAPAPVAALPSPIAPSTTITAPGIGATVTGTVQMTVTATSSAVAVEFLVDGVKVAEDLSAPFAVSIDTLGMTNGSHSFGARAKDAAGAVGAPSTAAVTVANVCSTASTTGTPVVNKSITAQTGTFTLTATLAPGSGGMDGGFGVSSAATSYFSGAAAIVLFDPAGLVKMRNGASYAAANSFVYEAGKRYELRLVVNVAARTYSGYIRPVGGAEVTLGEGFAFRSEWQGATSLANWVLRAESGSMAACNVAVR